ncbi:nucleobase:cation symporter-2 family protein [Streptomyces sp. NPDC059072]|uniref:nucleobase:cation symporter-2 family protein n=1 Tax=unclassified Streptomyces TaxID=2593676 RepID=UPI00368E1DC1
MSPRALARTPGAPTHPVDEILPVRRLVPAALQHVAGMYAGLTAPPLIIGGALGLTSAQLSVLLAAALLVSGLATIAQTLGPFGIGARLPLTNGVSFAVVAPVLAASASATEPRADALPEIFGATLIAGAVCFALAPAFCRLVRFFPPVVSGSVITLVGLSLLPAASTWARGGNTEAADYGSPSNLALSAATLAITLAVHRAFSGRFLGRIAVLLGMLVGTLIAVPLGKVDLDPLTEAPLFALPEPFAFGIPQFVPTVIATAVVVMFVSMAESTASLFALGAVSGRPTQGHTITGSLRAQGLATVLGGVLGSFTTTVYAQNVGLVALSRIRSRYVVTLCGAILVLLGLVPVLGSLVALVPPPVLGGAGVVFFGSVAVAGIRTLAKAALGTGHNSLIVSVTLAFGLVPVVAPDFYERLPAPAATVLGSGITAGCLVAVLLNYLLNHLGHGTEADPDPIAAQPGALLDGISTATAPPHRTRPSDPRGSFQASPERPRGSGAPFAEWPSHEPSPVDFAGTGPAGRPPTGRPVPGGDPAPPAPTPAYEPSGYAPPASPEARSSEAIGFPGPLHPLHSRLNHPRARTVREDARPVQESDSPGRAAPGDGW